MNIKVSEKDLKLIFLLAIVAIVGLAYWGNLKITENNMTMQTEIDALNTKYTDLKAKAARKPIYEKEIERSGKLYTGIMEKYANGLTQEHTIMNVMAAEEATGVWIKSVGLAGVSSIYSFGNVTSSNPSKAGQKVYSTDEIGVNTTLNISFEGTYDQVKDFIKYINTNEDKAKIGNVSLNYDATGKVSGSMQLTDYAIMGSAREFAELDLKNISVGTENIFDSETFVDAGGDGGHGQNIVNNYDLFVLMNAAGSDVSAVSVGMRDDIDGSKMLASNLNATESITIRISGTGGSYRVSYKLGNQTYPENGYADGVEFNCGETLDLLIMSSSRLGQDDLVGAELKIVNQSDLVLNYKVINEDEVSPRFKFGTITGQVLGY